MRLRWSESWREVGENQTKEVNMWRGQKWRSRTSAYASYSSLYVLCGYSNTHVNLGKTFLFQLQTEVTLLF